MLVSLEWLNDYVSLNDLEVETVAETLTKLGHEVEAVHTCPAIDDEVLVGKVLATSAHPNANRLTLCQVDVGKGEKEIICGATNVKAGMLVAVALPEACINGNKLTAAKIRGIVSNGMICSGLELGINKEHEGILALDDKYTIGTQINTLFATQDTVLELSITPNRGDCLGYLGIARELAAKLDRRLKHPRTDNLTAPPAAHKILVEIDKHSGCQRFCSLHARISGNPPSPYWMQRRLHVSGIRAMNTIVDITNYVMLECGQPSHAYDAEQITGNVIKVERANKASGFISLDGKERQIQAQDILLCDEARTIGLAGIIGGENSEISTSTTDIFFEVAHFPATCVRKTAKRLAIHTEAGHRFERSVDLGNTMQVARRIRHLLITSLPTLQAVSVDADDLCPESLPSKKIAVRMARARKILGMPALTQKTCMLSLKQLSFTLADQTDERLLFSVPSYRNDIEREIDLIEEIGRLVGLDKIPYELPIVRQSSGIDDTFATFLTASRNKLASLGLRETINFAFTAAADYQKLRLTSTHPLFPSLRLQNPINEELQLLQTTLLPNLLRCIDKNRRRQLKGTRLFEVGRSYFKPGFTTKHKDFSFLCEQGVHTNKREQNRPLEHNIAAGIIDTPYRFATWQRKEAEEPDIYLGKKLLLSFLANFNFTSDDLSIVPVEASAYPFLNPYASMKLRFGEHDLAYAGELHPRVLTDFKLEGRLLYFELLLDKIFSCLAMKTRTVSSQISKFPAVHRDLSLVLALNTTYRQIEQAIRNFPLKKYLQNFRLFDIFTAASLGDNKKSVAVSFAFESPDKTLTDAEVDDEVEKLLAYLQNTLSATLR